MSGCSVINMAKANLEGESTATGFNTKTRVFLPSAAEKSYGLTYYLKGALAGGICCGITHGALCPVDVVKTRIQLQPEVYNKGMVGGFKQVIEAEGTGALATGLG